jgi:hypothetical protein
VDGSATFNASKRTCRLFDSDMRKVLPRLASNRQNPGPITLLFPRLPFFRAAGMPEKQHQRAACRSPVEICFA